METTWKTIPDQKHINNWLICDPVIGSLVDWQYGKLNCQVVKRVTDTCKENPGPAKFARGQGYGPRLFSVDGYKTTYYYFDVYTGDDWPIIDPCGMGQRNHLKHVADPRGNIYIRKNP